MNIGFLQNSTFSSHRSNLTNSNEPPKTTGDVQKGRSPARSRFGGARSSKAVGTLARGAYTTVREHDKGPRTPLVGFFNIPNRRTLHTLIVSTLILLVPMKVFGFTSDIRNDPTKLIEKYLSLDKRGARLGALTSETLKPYINWTDEPVWGHIVVISDYTVIDDVTDWEILSSMEAIIPVTFRIVGTMYWETATFLPDARMEVTRYRIKTIDNRWRILEPMLPPHVGRKRLINFVRQTLLEETDEERARKLRLLRDALKQTQ